jgi:hypothetical protein
VCVFFCECVCEDYWCADTHHLGIRTGGKDVGLNTRSMQRTLSPRLGFRVFAQVVSWHNPHTNGTAGATNTTGGATRATRATGGATRATRATGGATGRRLWAFFARLISRARAAFVAALDRSAFCARFSRARATFAKAFDRAAFAKAFDRAVLSVFCLEPSLNIVYVIVRERERREVLSGDMYYNNTKINFFY